MNVEKAIIIEYILLGGTFKCDVNTFIGILRLFEIPRKLVLDGNKTRHFYLTFDTLTLKAFKINYAEHGKTITVLQ